MAPGRFPGVCAGAALIAGMVALMNFIYCYPMLRIAKWVEGKLGSIKGLS